MQIDPMTFPEFLLANGDENLEQYLEQVDTLEPIPDAFFNPLYEKLKMYYVTGGMPEPVLMWTEARDVSAMQEALSGIIGAYEDVYKRQTSACRRRSSPLTAFTRATALSASSIPTPCLLYTSRCV